MSAVPSVDGKDLRGTDELEAENEAKVEKLKSYGFPEEFINMAAVQVRVEAIVGALPPPLVAAVNHSYERMLGGILDEMTEAVERQIEAAKAPKLYVPEG